MADVNANLPMWSGAFWSQAERDRRREADDEKQYQRRLNEQIILQKLVNEGAITKQQAADAAANLRNTEDNKAAMERQKAANAAAIEQTGMDTRSREWIALQRDMAEEDLRMKLQAGELGEKAATRGLREEENKTAKLNAVVRAVAGTEGLSKDDPIRPWILESAGVPNETIDSIRQKRIEENTPKPGALSKVAGMLFGGKPATVKPIGPVGRVSVNGSTPSIKKTRQETPPPAPTGPAPQVGSNMLQSDVTPTLPIESFIKELQRIQCSRNSLQPIQK